jgi:uncharacterized membrane protein
MQKEPPTPDDADTTASDQGTSSDASGAPTLFSATRASRIRRPGSQKISGAIPGRTPLPGSDPTTPVTPPEATAPAARSRPVRPAGPRTYAHLLAGLCYLVPPFAPAAILFSPKPHPFARFHAIQALALFVVAATLGILFSLFTPTNLVLGIIYTLLVIAAVVLALLWIAAAIAAFEGVAVALPVLDRLIPHTTDLEEDLNAQARAIGSRANLEVAIAAGASIVILALTVALPLIGWFGKLSASALAPLGLPKGLPAWMVVSSLLFSLIFACIGLIALAVLVVGLRKGKFLPSLASGVAVFGAALAAAGTGLLIADTTQRSLYSRLEQQFQNMISSAPTADTNAYTSTVINGHNALTNIAGQEHALLVPGAVLLLLGLGILFFLLSQLYYKQ